MKEDLPPFPIGRFVVDALLERGLNESAVARALNLPRNLVAPIQKGLVDLTESSLNHLEEALGEPWTIIVVSSLGRPGKVTTDALRMLSSIRDARESAGKRSKRRARAKLAA